MKVQRGSPHFGFNLALTSPSLTLRVSDSSSLIPRHASKTNSCTTPSISVSGVIAASSSPGRRALLAVGSSSDYSRLRPMSSASCAIGLRKQSFSRAACGTESLSCAATSTTTTRSNVRSANTKSRRSFISPRKPSSASPTAILSPHLKPISAGRGSCSKPAAAVQK